jgi:hypothetical protein
MGWFNKAHDLLDCIIGASQDSFENKIGMEPVDEMFTEEGYEDAADLASDCLGTILESIDLKGALAEILSGLKSIPAALQGAAYRTLGALAANLPAQFDSLKQQPPTATVTRIGAQPKPKPTKKAEEPKKKPAAANDISNFTGTWLVANGKVVIKDNWTGRFEQYAKCDKNVDLGTIQNCTVTADIQFAPGADGKLNGYWAPAVAKDENGKVITLAPEFQALYKGKAFTVWRDGDKHVIRVHAEEGSMRPGTPHMCDKYARDIANNPARYPNSKYRTICLP